MKISYKDILFPLYFIGLLISTYVRFGEYFIAAILLVVVLLNIKRKNIYNLKIKKNYWLIFIFYYFVVSVIGLVTGYVGVKNLIEFVLKYIAMPATLYFIMPDNNNNSKMFGIIKYMILISVLYGFVEYFLRYNFMVNVVQLNNRIWMQEMMALSNYQPCSFFLHYNYYGCVLVAGIVLNRYFPYQKTISNVVYYLLTILQLLFCQSRICWIAIGVISIYWLFTSKKITSKTVKGIGIVLIVGATIIIYDPTVISSIIKIISSRFTKLFVYGFEDGSLGQRLGTLSNWPDYFNNNIIKGILGTGYQSISVDYMQQYSYFMGYSTADCELTVYLVETGLIGTIIVLVAIYSFIKAQMKQGTKVNMFCLVCLTGFLIECFTLDIVSNNIVFCLMLLCIVLGTQSVKLHKKLRN